MNDPKSLVAQYVRDEELHSKMDALLKIVTDVTTEHLALRNGFDRYKRKVRQLEGVVYHGAPPPEHATRQWAPPPQAPPTWPAWQPRPPAQSRPEWNPDDTGQNQIDDLQKALDEQRAALAAENARKLESLRWWPKLVKQDIPAAVAKAVAAALALAGLSYVMARLVH